MTPDTPMVLVEQPSEGVLLLRLNRPDQRNALTTPLLRQLAEQLIKADQDEPIRVAIITGNDRVFAAGADINEIEAAGSDEAVESPRFAAWAAIFGFTKPLVGAVEGWCLGAGAELMLRCDIVVASRGARIGQPETSLGIMPGAGGTAILPRRVGHARAMDMVLTGEPLTAEDAASSGLVSRLVDDGKALDEALTLAGKLAKRAPNALRAAKASVRRAMEMPLTPHLLSERRQFIALLGGAEKQEGIAAFREKRPPRW